MYYECHITIEFNPSMKPACFGSKESVQMVVELKGWKFSNIDGDPVFGKKLLCYATKHFNNNIAEVDVVKKMKVVAEDIANLGFSVIRQKVELVVYDSKKLNL